MKRVQDRWKSICKVGFIILVYTFVVIISPVIVVTFLSLCFYKYGILRLVVKYFKPKLIEGLNERDAFYATDRFWEDSRASCGLILVLEGNVLLDQIRANFFSQVIEAKSSSEGGDEDIKLFPRLTQIPQKFGGYYYWQKANYFLINEHIRPIETPIDENGLKKFAGTVLTLPFPNKRPLWEILVISSYSYKKLHRNSTTDNVSLGEIECFDDDKSPPSGKYSALVIRMHTSIANHDLMMRMVTLLCNRNTFSLYPLKLPDCVSAGKDGDSLQGSKCSSSLPTSRDNRVGFLDKIRALFKTPKNIHTFVQSFLRKPSSHLYSCDTNSTTVSWTTLNYPVISKIVQSQVVDRSAVLISVIVGALTSNGVGFLLESQTHHKTRDCDEEMNKSKNNSIQIMCSIDKNCAKMSPPHQKCDGEMVFLKSCCEYSSPSAPNETTGCIDLLQDVNRKLVYAVKPETGNQLSISSHFLKFLAIFPHSVVRHVNFHWLQGATIIFQQCKSDLGEILREVPKPHQSSRRISEIPNDLIFIGDHQLVDVIPLQGLQFRHSAIGTVAIKFQNAVKISMTINSDLLKGISTSTMQRTSSISSTNLVDKQVKTDHIVHSMGGQVGKIFEGSKDEHGFVRVPIM